MTVRRGRRQRVAIPEVRLCFQLHPGPDGSPGIANVAVTIVTSSGGTETRTPATTGSDGGVDVRFPPGASVSVEAFGTTFPLFLVDPPARPRTEDGVQHRLAMLGYFQTQVFMGWDAETDHALLSFRAEEGLAIEPTSSPVPRAVTSRLEDRAGR